MGGQPHRSLPKKRSRTCKDSGFAEQNSSEDMAPISERWVAKLKLLLLLPFFFFNFLKNESNLRWTAKGKWTAYYSAATFSRKVQGEQQEYWFPFSLWHIYWSRLQYWKTANPMICYLYHGPTGLQSVCVPLPNIVISNWSFSTKTYDTKVNLALRKSPSCMAHQPAAKYF